MLDRFDGTDSMLLLWWNYGDDEFLIIAFNNPSCDFAGQRVHGAFIIYPPITSQVTNRHGLH